MVKFRKISPARPVKVREKKVARLLWLLAFTGLAPLQGGTPYYKANITDLKDRHKVLYLEVNESEIKGDRRIYTDTFTDLNGKILAVETSTFRLDGPKESLISYVVDQYQSPYHAECNIVGGEARLLYRSGSKTKTAVEKVVPNFVTASTLVPYLHAHWDQILRGESVEVRFAVLDRQETIGFKLFKSAEKTLHGRPGLVVTMKPSSYFLAALVDPLYFEFSRDGSDLYTIEGQTVLMAGKEGDWDSFDGVKTFYPAKP